MGIHYGFDSAAKITQSFANTVTNLWNNGTKTATFWCRYFVDVDLGYVFTGDPLHECDAMYDHGVKYLVPIDQPGQSRISSSEAHGLSDAQVFADAIINDVYFAVDPLHFSSISELDCFLDVEANHSLSSDYWDGWADYLNAYSLQGDLVLFASMYCAPPDDGLNCSTAVSPNAYSVWSATPGYCNGCKDFGNQAWDPDNCFNGLHTGLWQMATETKCAGCSVGNGAHGVDLDESNPGENEHDFQFVISWDPI
jgi:hypothetical protein